MEVNLRGEFCAKVSKAMWEETEEMEGGIEGKGECRSKRDGRAN